MSLWIFVFFHEINFRYLNCRLYIERLSFRLKPKIKRKTVPQECFRCNKLTLDLKEISVFGFHSLKFSSER